MVAGQDPPSGDGGGEVAGRVGELPGAADDFVALVDRGGEKAAAWVGGQREVLDRVDEVHAAAGEDEVVPVDVVRVGGQVVDLDDAADAAERPVKMITLVITVQVPDTPEATMVPLIASRPLARSAGPSAPNHAICI
jgi:hypothetical protein